MTRRGRLIERLDDKDMKIAQLREALAPFAEFARKWNAKPLHGIDDEFYAIHSGEDGASLRLSDCRKALLLLEQDR